MARSQRRSRNRKTRFVVWWYRALLVSFFGLVTLLIVSIASAVPDPAVIASGLVVATPALVLAVRSLRSATIELRDSEVVLTGLFRSKRIPWSRIRDVGVTPGTSAVLVPWRVPYFLLDDGSTVRGDEIRSLREPSIADDVVAEAHRRLQT